MLRTWLIPSLLCFSFLANPSLAIGVENISSSQAEGRTGRIPTLKVWAGAGLNLNFVATGEYITKVWLDDPSRLTVDFDLPIDSGQAQIIHLRRIQGLKFDHLPSTTATLLTVVTQGEQGTKKLYQFELGYGSGQPEYIAVNINPDIRPQLREAEAQQQAQLAQIERLERGLALAVAANQSADNEKVFSRVETMLSLMKAGMSATESAQRVNLSLSVIRQLEQLANQGGISRDEANQSD